FRIICANGERRWIQAIGQVQRNAQGQPVGMVGINRDITQRKQQQLALTAYAQQVEDLYNTAPCGYHSLDTEGHITQINATELTW
ncbi:PAS domain S-box protein, partial [Haemophilus parainfluenzae]|uniref:PAS domain S-box protein n=1 Tax=Haemophilus parainfluenzae TaxID=729 RepID=UPI00124BAECB